MIGVAGVLAAAAAWLGLFGLWRLFAGDAARGGPEQLGAVPLETEIGPIERARRAHLISNVIAGVVAGLFLYSALFTLTGDLGVSLAGCIGGLVAPGWWTEFKRTNQMIRVSEQLDQVMGLLTSALRRGVPIEEAIMQAAEGVAAPLNEVLRLMGAATSVGLSFLQALEGARRHPAVAENPDWQVFVTQLSIAFARGANIVQTFESLRNAIGGRRRYRAAVAEQMGQHVIQGLTIFLVGIVVLVAYTFLSIEGLQPLLESPVGRLILVGSILGNLGLLRWNHVGMLRQLRRV